MIPFAANNESAKEDCKEATGQPTGDVSYLKAPPAYLAMTGYSPWDGAISGFTSSAMIEK
jgi:hypothetical protein